MTFLVIRVRSDRGVKPKIRDTMSMLNRNKDPLEEFTPIEEEAEEVAQYSGEHPALLHFEIHSHSSLNHQN